MGNFILGMMIAMDSYQFHSSQIDKNWRQVMCKKGGQFRHGSILFTGLLALTIVASSFVPASAQDLGNRVLLPLIHSGPSISQTVDGPFSMVDELSDFDVDEATESANDVSEVSAASCYGNARTYEIATGWSGWEYFTASNNCLDLNVVVSNFAPTDFCYVYAYAYYQDRYGNWYAGSGNGTAIGAGEDVYFYEWFEPITNIVDGTRLAVGFYAFDECGISEVRVAS